ncbi:MAG: tetratricopeptide repeat protein [Chloroflexi bacterium]|nr:tetratricopeptide repeat protein [Chloroflexota bacterium]
MPIDGRRSRMLFLTFMLLAGYALRVVNLGEASLWLDELIQVQLARAPLREMFQLVFAHANTPVDVLITKTLLRFGRQDAWLRMSSAYMGVLSIPLIYALARKLLPRPGPLVTALLFTLAPLAIMHHREVRPYATFLMLALLSTLLFLWSLEKQGLWPFFALSFLFLLHTHLFSLALLAVYGLYWLVWLLPKGLRARDSRRWLLAPAALALTTIAFLLSPASPDYVGRFTRAVLQGISGPRAMETLSLAATTYPFPGFAPIVKRIPQDFSGAQPAGLPALGLLFMGLWGMRRRPRALFFLLTWLILIPAAIVFALYQRDHWFSPRYIIHALPPFIMLVGMGAVTLARWLANGAELILRRRSRRPALFPFALAAVLALYFWQTAPALAQARGPSRENLRDGAAFLQQTYQPGTLIIAPLVGPYLLGHYLPKEMDVVDFQSPVLVESVAQNYERAFLLQTVYSHLTPRNTSWLTQENLVAAFQPGVEIYRAPAGEEARKRVQMRIKAILSGDQDVSLAELKRMAAEARKLKDWPLTIQIWEHFLQQAPNDSAAWTELGLAYRQAERLDAAIDAYQRAIELAPNNAWAHLLLANALRLNGQPETALRHAQDAVDIAPHLPDAWSALGFAQLELGDAVAARAAFERGLEQRADALMLRYGLAQAASAARDSDAAELWQALLDLNPPSFMRNAACKHLQNAHTLCP